MTVCGTFMFMAPEILGKVAGAKPVPFKGDVYAMGQIAYYMMT